MVDEASAYDTVGEFLANRREPLPPSGDQSTDYNPGQTDHAAFTALI